MTTPLMGQSDASDANKDGWRGDPLLPPSREPVTQFQIGLVDIHIPVVSRCQSRLLVELPVGHGPNRGNCYSGCPFRHVSRGFTQCAQPSPGADGGAGV